MHTIIKSQEYQNNWNSDGRSDMFMFTQEPSSGSHFLCLAKLQLWFYILVFYDVVNDEDIES
jgi:hypothetical protein